jgi:HD-like signal output (HDOD) protein
MTSTTLNRARCEDVAAEIDHARTRGRLRQVLIPACPTLLAELRAELARAEPDLSAVARIAASDVALAATLIGRANSPLYAAGQQAQTLGQAMNRLGLSDTAAAMTAFLARRALPANSPHLQRFWERARKRSVAMGFIATRLPGMSKDVAHTYGLFCHVGQPVLLQSVPGYGGTLVEAAARRDRSSIATENANHHTDHAVGGALVARVWRLAPAVVAAIRLHHELPSLVDGSRTEPEVVSLVAAGLVAEQLMRRHEALPADEDWNGQSAAAMEWLQIGPADLEAWNEDGRAALDEA